MKIIHNKVEKHTFPKSANNREGMLKWGKIECLIIALNNKSL